MRLAILLAGLLAGLIALPGWAQLSTDRERQQQLEEAQRDQALRAQRDAQRRLQRARDNCNANHGVDCDSEQGLQEWLLLERTRAEAVLDRVIPPASSSSGASSPQPAR
jgi:type II secretory pathway pseudopilin PulG